MALENFVEMSEHVGSKDFLKRKAFERALVKNFPTAYRSRYELVMYSHTPYSVAFEAGKRQSVLLKDLMERYAKPEEMGQEALELPLFIDLTAFYERFNVVLSS